MNKLSKKDYILLVICALSLAYFTRGFFYYTAAMITGGFENATYCLIGTLTSIAALIATFAFLKHQYVRPLKKVERIVLAILSSIFSLVALVFYFSNASIVFGNIGAGIDMNLIGIVSLIANLAIIATAVLCFINLKKEVAYTYRPLENITKGRITSLVFLGLYFGYGLICFLINFIVIANIARYPLGYVAVIYLFLLMMYNFVYIIMDGVKKSATLSLVNGLANIFGVVLFVVAELVHFNFMCEVAKPFCPIDFAVSIALLPILTLLMILGMLIYFVVSKIKKA